MHLIPRFRRAFGRRERWIWGLAAILVALIATVEIVPTAGVFMNRPVISTLADGRSGTFRLANRTAFPGPSDRGDVPIDAELTLPRVAEGRVPAAVLLHGSDGLGPHQARYAQLLEQWGYAVMRLDSFTPRGIESTVGNQETVPTRTMVADAYTALRALATHPRVDPDRIVLIGWSKGGRAALLAARSAYAQTLAPEGRRFAAHVGFYPWCGEQEDEIRHTGAPILILLAERDDWSGTTPCVEYARRLRAAGLSVRDIVYAQAEHGFDYEGRFRTFVPEAHGYGACVYYARDTGFVDPRTGRLARWPALARYLQACRVKGAHVGTNASARARAIEDLRAFLDSVVGGSPVPAAGRRAATRAWSG